MIKKVITMIKKDVTIKDVTMIKKVITMIKKL